MICGWCGAESRPDEDGNCIICSHRFDGSSAEIAMPPIPPKPSPPVPLRMRDYYNDNYKAILADREQNGEKYTMKRWGIGSGALSRLVHFPPEEKKKVKNTTPTKDPPAEVTETPTSTVPPIPHNGHFEITITEEDLNKMDNDEYYLFWYALGKMIRRREETRV